MASQTSTNTGFERVERAAADGHLTVDQRGKGRPVVLLHGGAGPNSVLPFAELLSSQYHVITPTHPGFGETPRADHVSSVKDLARLYSRLLVQADLRQVLLIGFSIGGWIAAETILLDQTPVAGLVLIDAVGMTVPGHEVLDVFSIAPNKIADFSFHRPDGFRIDLSKLPERQAAGFKANFAALAAYGRAQNMQDPDLGQRLARISRPTLVLWGESDRVVSPGYGQAFAAAIPNSLFELIPESGHLPQVEQSGKTLERVREFERSLSEV